MTFEVFMELQRNKHSKLIEEICSDLGISLKTYYNRKNNNSWTKIERKYLSKKTGYPEKELFPDPTKVAGI